MEQPVAENSQTIKNQLQTLLRLQALDNEVAQRRRQIDALTKNNQSAQTKLHAQQEALTKLKNDLDHLLKDRRQAELASKEKLEQIKKLNSQLFEVKTNDAYNILQTEIQQKKQKNGLVEERILEMMMAEEEIRARTDQVTRELQENEKQTAQAMAENQKTTGQLESEIKGFQSQWETAAQPVRQDYLELYKKLRDGKNGLALAKIENNICLGCRLTIRPQAVIELQKYRTLLFCDNCARILYVD